LSISIGNRELLSHANFQLQRGRHYVLHGRNGIGKSTLLRAIATDQIPSIPRGVNVLLLGQTVSDLEEDVENLSLNDRTVLEYVVRSDAQRETLLHESKTLGTAVENSADPNAAVRAYRKISHERLGRKLEQVRQIALRRSGGRGADAKKVLVKTEADFEASEQRLDADIGPSEMGDESQKAAEMMVEVQTSLELVSLCRCF
jgi:ATP-binding cassette subfamily F protein 3